MYQNPYRYLKNSRQEKWKTQIDCQIYKKKIKKKIKKKAEKNFEKKKKEKLTTSH